MTPERGEGRRVAISWAHWRTSRSSSPRAEAISRRLPAASWGRKEEQISERAGLSSPFSASCRVRNSPKSRLPTPKGSRERMVRSAVWQAPGEHRSSWQSSRSV